MANKTEIVPSGFQSVNAYLIVEGAAKFLGFLKQAFEAEEKFRAPQPDGRIMHAEVRVGDVMLEAGDANAEWKAMPANLHYYVEDADRIYRRALQAGGTSLYEPREMDYGDREGGVLDPCGNNWFIATHKKGNSYRPAGLRDVTSGLSLHNAAEFVTFIEKAFGAQVLEKHESKPGIVGHAKARIGDTVIELSEAHGKWGPRPMALHYYVENCDEIFHKSLSAGAKAIFDPQDKPYGERNGGVQDAWGNHWFIATRAEILGKEGLDGRTRTQAQSNP